MKKLLKIIFITILLPSISHSAFEDVESSPRAEGMAEAVTACPRDPSEAIYNPAGIAFLKGMRVNAFYKKPFGFVNSAGASISFENTLGSTAINARWLSVKGDYRSSDSSLISQDAELHREMFFSVTHAIKLNEFFYSGLSVSAYSLKQERFGSAYALGLDFGVLGSLYRVWKIGVSMRNINSPSVGRESPEYLPRVIRAGLSFSPSDKISTSVDFRQEIGYPLRISFGQEYGVSDYLFVRAGVQTEPVRFSAGFSLYYSQFGFDYSVIQHSVLPLTHVLSMGYTLL